MCSHRNIRFAGSNPSIVGGFYLGVVRPESENSGSLKSINPEK